ncbi:carboxy terminal-processing peptidase [Aliidiomarina sanyensis]|uniref:Carboxy terminal-processing peptidase n=1 Tax=Aliidiomarina sanyensis TaxID=1249555 RepID=A0A432WRT6_9GAMM|nr:carboxy terminal-processing peptidase [Aliidiomarina sanyensis]RUO36478.1 carboxy terminal-processing peptidase [Aliidiomarina sanyensis]
MIKHVVQSVAFVGALFIASVGLSTVVAQDYSLSDIPKLTPESQHKAASRRIASYFTRYHYSRIELDEAMGQQIFDRYFEQLDYNRMFLLQSDVDRFQRYRNTFHEQLIAGNLDAAYAIHQVSLERRFERFEFALSVLDSKEFSFDEDAEFKFDRSEAPWATSKDELDAIWVMRVKNDALNLVMAGREEDEIIDNLKRRYSAALQRITQAQSEDAFQVVMNAFARSVDAHTSYLSPRNAERFQQNMNLSLEGIGALLRAEYDYTVIQSLVPGGPAEQSGQLSPNDRIIGVAQGDQEFVDIIGMRLDDVVQMITGPKGSVVRLQVLRDGQGAGAVPSIVEITRDEVRLEDREAKLRVETTDNDRRIGIIEIPGFYNNLTAHVKKHLETIQKDPVDALIIDLRGNGGGALNESITLTGLFIPAGPVVQVRESSGRVDVSQDPDPAVHYDGPLVVMVDRFSASASEIFAAAMQDYNRALVIGENTFGKGTVQQHRGLQRRFDLHANPMGSVQYTMAKFYRITGGSTQHKGVVPDIVFPSVVNPDEYGESRADNALPWAQIEPVEFVRLDRINAEKIAQLIEAHEARIAEDPEFAYILEDITRFRELRDRTSITLVKAEREAESAADRARQLQRVNERLARAGREPVESVDDVDSEFLEPDPFLDEAILITLDYLQSKQQAGRDVAIRP